MEADNTSRVSGVPWSPGGMALRIFFTCWIVYALHFSTNIVREIYLALSIGEDFSFRVDDYAGLHPDLFEKEGYGWHIGSNPGVSMLAAIPFAISRPAIDYIVEKVKQTRERKKSAPPHYDSPWPLAQKFYENSWRRGYDIKFGLAAFVMHAFCMAPSSALAAAVMFLTLRRVLLSEKMALWLCLLYAFGTPVFFRTGYLNHNLMLGHIAFLGFIALWNPFHWSQKSERWRYFIAGLTGGTAVLFDYSGVIFLLGLFIYGILVACQGQDVSHGVRMAVVYGVGTLGPILFLWIYQWQSFGHPFFPGQHWMPPVEWIDRGYQGFSMPQWELFLSLGFDYRYGLFVTSPLMLLVFLALYQIGNGITGLTRLESGCILGIFIALWVFFSCVNYTRLQFNTGIRYMIPIFPFLFIPVASYLATWSSRWIWIVGLISVTENWALAMYRDVERGLGVIDPLLHVLIGGFQLPVLTTISRLKEQFGEILENGVSPLPLFVVASALIAIIWHDCGTKPPLMSKQPP